MREKTVNFLLSLTILVWIFVVCIPYFSSYLLEMKRESDGERAYQQSLRDRKEKQERAYLTGNFDPAKTQDFVAVPKEYALTGNTIYLRKEALDAFEMMARTAKTDGVILQIASATRNFEYQKNLWEKKWTGATLVDGENLSETIPNGEERFRKILEYSAAPATSRHHWGTDIDINGADPVYFNSEKGQAEYAWLSANASRFGFCQVYNQKDARVHGYNEEKWHWSYLPIAKELTKKYATLVRKTDIRGFAGSEYADKIDLLNEYILSINPDCL